MQRELPRLLEPMRKNGFLLMLDFDGVLAPIVPHYKDARMSAKTRRLLAACARRGKVAVISGRALADVRARVNLPGMWYAGNHGSEWSMGKARGCERLSKSAARQLRDARDVFIALSKHYPGVVVEDKKLTFSVHFRALPHSLRRSWREQVRRIAKQYKKVLDTAEGSEYIFNVRTRSGRTKGDAVRLARQLSPRRMVPIYIGDDTTDEDALFNRARDRETQAGPARIQDAAIRRAD